MLDGGVLDWWPEGLLAEVKLSIDDNAQVFAKLCPK